MKRTIKSILAAVGLAFIGLGSLLTATPAQAAYLAPYVPPGCTLYVIPLYPYPYTPGAGQYVYCGNTPTTYLATAGDAFMNLPFSAGSSLLRQKFEAANVTLYVFASPQDAQAKLGTTNIPTSPVVQPGILGVTVVSPASPATTKFVAVWENYIGPSGKLISTETTVAQTVDHTNNRFKGAVNHEAGHIMDYLYQSLGVGSTYFSDSINAAYTADLNGFNARPKCSLFPNPPVCVAGVPQAPYASMTNLQILLSFNPAYTRFFTALSGSGKYRELISEETAIIVNGTHGGISGDMDDWINAFRQGSTSIPCTKLYTEKRYKLWRLPTAAEKSANSCP